MDVVGDVDDLGPPPLGRGALDDLEVAQGKDWVLQPKAVALDRVRL